MSFEPYRGNNPYVFASYAHKGKRRAKSVVKELQRNGYRVWYDLGIDPGTEWDKIIEEHLDDCSFFLALITRNYLASTNCLDELYYAAELDLPRALVFLEDVELPAGFDGEPSELQFVINYYDCDIITFYRNLFEAPGLDPCLSGTEDDETKDEGTNVSDSDKTDESQTEKPRIFADRLSDVGDRVPGSMAVAKIVGRIPGVSPSLALVSALLLLAAAGVVAAWAAVALASALLFPPYALDEATFPDGALRAAVASQADADGDGAVSREEAASLESFAVDGAAALDGLERFPNLRSIEVRGTALQGADLSPFRSLETFSAPDAPLDSLDVSSTPSLSSLDVPDSTEVSGLEATGLTETWLPVSSKRFVGNDDSDMFESIGDCLTRNAHGDPETFTTYWYPTAGGSYISENTTTCTYGDEGRVLETNTEVNDVTFHSTDEVTKHYEYDDAGHLISIQEDGPYDETETTYVYDNNGNLQSIVIETIGDVSESSGVRIEYNDNNQPIALISIGGSSDGEVIKNYTRDSTGHLVDFVSPIPRTDSYESHRLIYDEHDNVVKVECALDESHAADSQMAVQPFSYVVTYSYDENGRVTEAAIEGDSNSSEDVGSSTTATCTYDDAGNLTRVVVEIATTSSSQTSSFKTIYEQSYERFFTLVEDNANKSFLYIAPTYDDNLFRAYWIEPFAPRIPLLEERFIALENTTEMQYQ